VPLKPKHAAPVKLAAPLTQPPLFSPPAQPAPIALVTPPRVRTDVQRVISLLGLYDAEEVARAFHIESSFLLTKWLRGQRLSVLLDSQIRGNVRSNLTKVEAELADKQSRLAG
jgi:hypothetical protein